MFTDNRLVKARDYNVRSLQYMLHPLVWHQSGIVSRSTTFDVIAVRNSTLSQQPTEVTHAILHRPGPASLQAQAATKDIEAVLRAELDELKV
jgi:hypothetical protein